MDEIKIIKRNLGDIPIYVPARWITVFSREGKISFRAENYRKEILEEWVQDADCLQLFKYIDDWGCEICFNLKYQKISNPVSLFLIDKGEIVCKVWNIDWKGELERGLFYNLYKTLKKGGRKWNMDLIR